MVREDLINSAVSFLQDPSVASAPVEKRIQFLQSKNLTQEEVNVALARADGSAPPGPPTQQNYGYRQQQGPPAAGFGQYPGYWQPPPEVPRRDWRDWFIMATVMGGVGFGLYVTAKRYILPLIKPPTPPQLTQDKESIDESFTKAFALLETLETDTKTLKEAEEARTTRLDVALSELETVIASLRDSDRKREDDARRNTDEIRMLRDLIPKALESEKNATETRLRDLTSELKSLKTLMGNRMGGSSPAPAVHRPTSSASGTNGLPTPAVPTVTAPAPAAAPSPSVETPVTDAAKSPAAAASPKPAASGSSFPRFGNGKGAAIPAWQMAAAKKSQENLRDTSASGTAVEETAATS